MECCLYWFKFAKKVLESISFLIDKVHILCMCVCVCVSVCACVFHYSGFHYLWVYQSLLDPAILCISIKHITWIVSL